MELTIRPSQVPFYLRGGAFYTSLDLTNDDELKVPEQVLKMHEHIWLDFQLKHYLQSLRYWLVDDVSENCIKYIICRDQSCLPIIEEFAATFPTLKALQQTFGISDAQEKFHAAIRSKALPVVRAFVALSYTVDGGACSVAATLPESEILEFLQSVGGELSFETIKIALSSGSIKSVRYMEGCGLKIVNSTRKVTTATTRGELVCVGNVECLKYILANGCVINHHSTTHMAECNSLDLLRYCHEELHAPWHSAEITTAAASAGALECLIYAHEHGCPINNDALVGAEANHRTACAAYLRQQGLVGVSG